MMHLNLSIYMCVMSINFGFLFYNHYKVNFSCTFIDFSTTVGYDLGYLALGSSILDQY